MSTYMPRKAAASWWGIDLPKDVCYLYKDHPGQEWKAITWTEIHDKRTKKQEACTAAKRRHARQVPCAIWVFCNENTVFFEGWYLYIRTRKEDYALNFRCQRNHLIRQVMQVFPCGIFPDTSFLRDWMPAFEKTHHLDSPKRRLNAVAYAWCTIESGEIISITAAPAAQNLSS